MVEQNQTTNRLCWSFIYAILILVNVAYFPIIIGTPYYSVVTSCVAGLTIIFVFLNIADFFKWFGNTIILLTTFFLVLSLIVLLIYGVDDYFKQSSNFYLSMLCFSLGFLAPCPTQQKIKSAIAVFCITACIMGLYSVFRNVGGFQITTLYGILLKNSSGVLLATATVLCIYISENGTSRAYKLLWIIMGILCAACLLVFRSRSCIVSLMLCGLVVGIKIFFQENNHEYKRKVCYLLILILALLVMDLLPMDFIYDSMFKNKSADNFNELSSGRGYMFELALSIFEEHPLGGTLGTNIKLQSVDNFLINQIGRYGWIGIITNVPFYFFIWYITIRGLIKTSLEQMYPFLALLILCMVSLTEAPFPFGPGTPCVCAYVLVGFYYNPWFSDTLDNLEQDT